ncbi:MAG: hypothetical protein CL920_13960 [Deltaproteobacteria bacterium]|nr:hypothetical protein [Deltaproteobacteria bacterium]
MYPHKSSPFSHISTTTHLFQSNQMTDGNGLFTTMPRTTCFVKSSPQPHAKGVECRVWGALSPKRVWVANPQSQTKHRQQQGQAERASQQGQAERASRGKRSAPVRASGNLPSSPTTCPPLRRLALLPDN